MRTHRKADRIDLDQYYTPYCEGRLTLPKLAPYRGNLPERLVTFTEARALYNIKRETRWMHLSLNSMGCRAVPVSSYFWEKGFLKALERLEPTAIIRYGPRMVMEEKGISRFYQNPHLTRMRTHKSCDED